MTKYYCWPCCQDEASSSSSSSPSSSSLPSSSNVIVNPTQCLIDLAASAGRTEPWPRNLYLEDDFGHVNEFTWDDNRRQWILPQGTPMTVQGSVRTCTGVSRENVINCFGSDLDGGRHGLTVSTSASTPFIGDWLFFQTTLSRLRIESGYQYDPIDISFENLATFANTGCNPSGPNANFPTNFRLYE